MRFVPPYIKNSTPIYMSVEKMVEPRCHHCRQCTLYDYYIKAFICQNNGTKEKYTLAQMVIF